jgi:HEAT repeat protein
VLAHVDSTLSEDQEVLVATARCLGVLASRHPDRRGVDVAVDTLGRWVLKASSLPVVHSALAALARIGSGAHSAAPVVFDTLVSVVDSGIHDEEAKSLARACMATLAALGTAGVQNLLSVLCDVSRPPEVRATVAHALAPERVTKAAHGMVADTMQQILLHERTNDSLLRGLVRAFARIALEPHAVPLKDNEEAAAVAKHAPAMPRLGVLASVVEDAHGYHLSVRLAAADAMTVHGGAQAEALLLQLLLKHRSASVRATAANVLIHTGGSPCVGLLLATNDTDESVREEALASLTRIGLRVVVDTLRGPQRGKLTTALRSCQDFLQFQQHDFISALRDELAAFAAAVAGMSVLSAPPAPERPGSAMATNDRTPSASTVTAAHSQASSDAGEY